MGEKFSIAEINNLRSELLQGGLDSRQSAEVLQIFLMGHGYGISQDAALEVASRLASPRCSLENMRDQLETVALVM